MEPTIKYENCETMYTSSSELGASPHNLKRNYTEIEERGEVPNVGGQNTSHYANIFSDLSLLQPKMILPDGAPVKRSRRGESAILFSPPFFVLNTETMGSGGNLIATCLSCQVTLRGHKNVSSNFLKHMKRVHPEMHTAYENIKLSKFHSTETKNIANRKPAPKQGRCEYFDASNFLENMMPTKAEEEYNSETTDTGTGTPPNAGDTNEISDNVSDSQQNQLPVIRNVSNDDELLVPHSTENPLNVDLSTKTLQLMSNMLDEKLKAFVTKSSFNETARVVSNLMDNRKASNSAKVNNDIDYDQLSSLQEECKQLRATIEQTKQGKRLLQKELQAMDAQIHQREFIIRNIQIKDNNPKEAATILFQEYLGLEKIEIVKAIVLSKNTSSTSNSNLNKQNLLVEVTNNLDAKKIFRNCRKLKNTGIFIERSVSQYARKRRGKLLVLRKEILRRKPHIKAFVRNEELIIDGKHFQWDEVDGLYIDDEPNDAVEYLKTHIGLDLKEFINVLKNYNVHL